ncbi:inositol monophosphatase [Patescibacteria group bacterium]|nr:inositol monophosphatase [Patescibacteria group bacterium]
MSNYKKELEFAKTTALKAGDIIIKNFLHSKATVKANISPVTETDLAVSRMVIDEVKKTFPQHQVMDEELQNDKQESNDFLWVCDPIDGTVPFANHIPTSMFSLALCKNGDPVVAVIFDPYMKRLLYSVKGEPSFANDQITSVRKSRLQVGDTVYALPYWFKDFDSAKFFSIFRQKKMLVSYVESIVYLAMLVATGAIPAFVSSAANPWDRAAAKLIVEAAGGKMTDEKGSELTVFGKHELLIASNAIVHEEILEIVKSCRKT